MLLDGDNVVNTSVVLGDINIFVPNDFPIKIDLSCVAGRVSYDQKISDGFLPGLKHIDNNYDSSSKKLFIKGKAVFGDVKISSILK